MRIWERKLLNGWRVFGGEIGVVTLGVLIALIAQQVAEEVSWRNRANGARQALRKEIADHLLLAMEVRVTQPCIAAQLDRLEQRLLTADDQLRPAPLFGDSSGKFAVRVPSRSYVFAAWRGALGEGVSSHLLADERAKLAVYTRPCPRWMR